VTVDAAATLRRDEPGDEGAATASHRSLEAEADYLHRALFGTVAPEPVRRLYVQLLRGASLAAVPRCEIATLMARGVDLEAVELALRRRNPVNSLTQRFHALCYLVEARPEYFDRFVNEQQRFTGGFACVAVHAVRSMYKLLKGCALLRIHNVS